MEAALRAAGFAITDSLTPQTRQIIDSEMVKFVSSRPRQVMAIVRHIIAALPAIPSPD